MVNSALLRHYMCLDDLGDFSLNGPLSTKEGFFTFGAETICYGHCSAVAPAAVANDDLTDTVKHTAVDLASVSFPFDPTNLVENLRRERYLRGSSQHLLGKSMLRQAYYQVRPLLPLHVRKHLQRFALRRWKTITFPRWPVDTTVEELLTKCLIASLKASGMNESPFIWFWPDGHSAAAILTHDVETEAGRAFCGALMDMDDAFAIKASFQVIPKGRYNVTQTFLDAIRSRGFEINIHDLNHDGRLFSDHEEFRRRVREINKYVVAYDAKGFRSGALYRNVEWYDLLDISYDMSIPNCGQLDPQRGGCCTVFPYFVGDVLELPVTLAQDYSLFHILGDYSLRLWEEQIERILEVHGLLSVIIHPDYVSEKRAQVSYRTLLEAFARLRVEKNLWTALPGEVNEWWRLRSKMKLRNDCGVWRIEGKGSERARIAYASVEDEKLTYRFN